MTPLDWSTSRAYVNEPSLAEVAPGRLLMMMRNGLGRLFQAWSFDDGETWTNPLPTSLAASTTPAQIRSIPSTRKPSFGGDFTHCGSRGWALCRTRPTVRCGLNRCGAGSHPSRHIISSTDLCRALSSFSSSANPTQITRGRRAFGKTPTEVNRKSNSG